ncbi:hypothetical protein POTOM_039322 [Populus tomentosa]|uniref:non-specific serine/threonine protein kinase n=1 Tax=Populus tomentosa TaxID=118781 RepID=A0A8X8CIT6_POPTO|nr:hypothetical protein POTOM_039322 [Populus tomentosa]
MRRSIHTKKDVGFLKLKKILRHLRASLKWKKDHDEIYWVYRVPDDSYLLRLIVDHPGHVKALTWRQSDGQWKEYWKSPQFHCDYYGNCGAYSTCELANLNEFGCVCLPGFEPKYPLEWSARDGSGGCVRKRLHTSSVCQHGEGFVKVENVILPESSAAVWVDMSKSLADCEVQCKRNCSCSAYAIIAIPGQNYGCLTWYKELVDINYVRSESHDLYVRVDAYELADTKRKSNDSREKTMLAVLAPSIALLWFLISLFAYLWLKKRAKKGTELQVNSTSTELEYFRLSTVTAATNNFSPANKLGQGGFGSVYKGLLANGKEVAIKRLSRSSGQGTEEFKNEVMVIARLQHRNLVKLLGYCTQDGEQMLIYEYLTNKSLDSFLFDESRRLLLDWRNRFDIIVGIARGILYLHQDSRLRIIHRDLKCSNILLDAEMNPKISDFGMAKIFEGNQTEDRTRRVVGTYGYMSPEYAVFGNFSVKSDVFSFGVMLLEIVSGKKNNRFYQQNPPLTLIGYVWELWREDKALEIVDPSLKELYHPRETLKCIHIGLLCVQEDAADRPSMLAVVFMLSNETEIPSPKQPAFLFRKSDKFPDIALDVEDGQCSVNESRHRGKVILIKLKLDGTEVLMQEQTARWLPKPKLMHQWSETLGFLAFNQQPENLVPNLTSEGTSEGDEPAPGDFSFGLNPNGSPQYFLYMNLAPYWRGGPWNGRSLSGTPDLSTRVKSNRADFNNEAGLFNYSFVSNKQGTYITFHLRNTSVFSSLVLEPTGIVKRVTWREDSQDWALFWLEPDDSCDVYANCGSYSMCNFNNAIKCSCLPGFEPLSPHDWSTRCVEKRKFQCGKGAGEGFLKMANVKIPDAIGTHVYTNLSLKECEMECLRSCNCSGYASLDINNEEQGCLAWYGELNDMQQYTDEGQDFYLRVEAGELAAYAKNSSKSSTATNWMVRVIILFAIALLLLFVSIYLHSRKKRARKGYLEKRRRCELLSLDPETCMSSSKDLPSAHEYMEHEEKMLIYEYMPNKSLDCFIFDQSRKASLGWEERFEIIMGIARGILYLHQDSSGYMSPEYALDGLFSVKSDVFSFGVLLLEIISGRKNIGFFKEDLSSNLIRYTWNLWKDEKALEMMDLSIRQSCPSSEVLRCIQVGLLCVQDCAANRPTMSEIIFMLSTDTTLPSPTQPTFSLTRSQNDPSSPAIDTSSSVNQVTISLVDAR